MTLRPATLVLIKSHTLLWDNDVGRGRSRSGVDVHVWSSAGELLSYRESALDCVR